MHPLDDCFDHVPCWSNGPVCKIFLVPLGPGRSAWCEGYVKNRVGNMSKCRLKGPRRKRLDGSPTPSAARKSGRGCKATRLSGTRLSGTAVRRPMQRSLCAQRCLRRDVNHGLIKPSCRGLRTFHFESRHQHTHNVTASLGCNALTLSFQMNPALLIDTSAIPTTVGILKHSPIALFGVSAPALSQYGVKSLGFHDEDAPKSGRG